MCRARANVGLLVERLVTLGYRFLHDPFVPPSDESLAALRALEAHYGVLPLSLQMWHEVVGVVDFMGVCPRLSSYDEIDPRDMVIMWRGQSLRVSMVPDFGVLGPSLGPHPDPDASICTDPLVVWPCVEALVDEYEDDEEGEESEQSADNPQVVYNLCLAPDSLHKANVSGSDGPHLDFAGMCKDALLRGDDWEGIPFVTYLRTAFAWGGFPGLRHAVNPPRDLLDLLCEGLLPL